MDHAKHKQPRRQDAAPEEVPPIQRRDFLRKALHYGLIGAGGVFLINNVTMGSLNDHLTPVRPETGQTDELCACPCACNCMEEQCGCVCNCACDCGCACECPCVCECNCECLCNCSCQCNPLPQVAQIQADHIAIYSPKLQSIHSHDTEINMDRASFEIHSNQQEPSIQGDRSLENYNLAFARGGSRTESYAQDDLNWFRMEQYQTLRNQQHAR